MDIFPFARQNHQMNEARVTNDLKVFADALPYGAIIVDAIGDIKIANATAIDILQVKLLGLAATAVIRSPAFTSSLADIQKSGGATEVDIEFRGRQTRQVNAHLSPLGTAGDVLVVLRDLTREQAIEKMRSDFVANASHEMRTPLASIIGSIETLQGAAKDDAKARDMFLATMLSQAHRMKRLIDDLLTLSRIELNEHVRPVGKVALMNVLKQAKANLAPQAKEANVQVEITGEEDILVAGESDELLQIAQNLLENAIKYGASGGRIDMNCRTLGANAVFVVRDFGRGIPDVHLPRLTERFYRVSTQESRQRGGTGLGLAIVKHIVLRHRGRLDVASQMGLGSAFTVTIPLYNS
jgi:two-component system, OmpR family, phosphate regulon sensor histidine kinase PhoR